MPATHTMAVAREMPNLHTCDGCGLVYGSMYDFLRHTCKCQDNRDDETVANKSKYLMVEAVEDSDNEEDDNPGNTTLRWMWKDALDQAKDGEKKKLLFKMFKRYLEQAIDLRNNRTTNTILDGEVHHQRTNRR